MFRCSYTTIRERINSCLARINKTLNTKMHGMNVKITNMNFAKRLYLCEEYTNCFLGCDAMSFGTSTDISCHPLKIGPLPLPYHIV